MPHSAFVSVAPRVPPNTASWDGNSSSSDWLAHFEWLSHKRVAGAWGRIRVGVAGGHINGALLRIDGGRRPHARARWPPKLRALPVLAHRMGRFRDGVALPDLLARGPIQRGECAAKLAALVF